nr:HDOD domain-containing protein [Marinibactrum halimedae]
MNSLIENATNMPSIPKVVQELIVTFSNDDFEIDELSKKVASDQALTAKVLRIANSAKYGGNRTIGSVNDAIVLMGFSALRTMVLASGFSTNLKAPEGFDGAAFWRRSFMVANRAKWIANYCNANPDVAYTCGMMHAVGDLLIHILLPEKAQAIQALAEQGANKLDLQVNQLGFDYTQAGEELATRWRFPEEIAESIRWQANPTQSPNGLPILALINYLAIYLTDNVETSHEVLLANFPNDLANEGKVNLVDLLGDLESLEDVDAGLEELLSD